MCWHTFNSLCSLLSSLIFIYKQHYVYLFFFAWYTQRPVADGGGPLSMPLCFWAAQSAVAASELCVGTRRSLFSPYLPPHTAAAAIQCAYHSYVDNEWEWWLKLSLAGYALEPKMNRAMRNLRDSNTFVFLVCDSYWIPHWDDG
jgi:hypothetical protein